MVTRQGMIKKTPVTEYANIRKNGIIAINLKDDDELIEVKTTDNTRDIFMVSREGMCIRFSDRDVRSTGRSSMGVRGMNLSQGDEVIGMQMNTQGGTLLLVSERGMGKRTKISEFTLQRRGGKGLKCYKITGKTGELVGVKAVNDDHEIMMITTQGIIIRLKCSDISTYGRITSGVKLINLDKGEDIFVASIAKVREHINPSGREIEEPEETAEQAGSTEAAESTEPAEIEELTETEEASETEGSSEVTGE